MNTLSCLRAAVKEGDPVARLALADFLEEQGQPLEAMKVRHGLEWTANGILKKPGDTSVKQWRATVDCTTGTEPWWWAAGWKDSNTWQASGEKGTTREDGMRLAEQWLLDHGV